jgi:hypothetical protein
MDYIISKWLMEKYIYPIGVSKFDSRLYTSRSCPKNAIKNLQPINPKLDLEISSCFIAPNATKMPTSYTMYWTTYIHRWRSWTSNILGRKFRTKFECNFIKTLSKPSNV